MNEQQMLDLIREAKGKGLDPETFLEQKIEERRKSDEELLWVQVMPRCSIAGVGRYPAKGQLPRHKALDLAKCGKVLLLGATPHGGLAEDIPWYDKRAGRYLKDMVEVRKSADRTLGEKLEAQTTRWDDERFNPAMKAEREREEREEAVLVAAAPVASEGRASRREARA